MRHKVKRQVKGLLQLDLFEPRDGDYDYRVAVTNKMGSEPEPPPNWWTH